MRVRGSLATVSLIAGALCGCAANAGNEDASEEAPAEDQPLDVTVDALDIVHGALRISATMVDGAADVSVQLGGDCEHREVGGGVSTLSTLVWSLGEADVAAMLPCGLLVRAHVRDGARFVNKVAEFRVMLDVAAAPSDSVDDGAKVEILSATDVGISMVFSPAPAGARLTAGDSLLGAEPPESDPGEAAADDDSGRFVVPPIDFARSVLRKRPLFLEGSSFVASLSVGCASIQEEPQTTDAPEDPTDTAEEEAIDQP